MAFSISGNWNDGSNEKISTLLIAKKLQMLLKIH